MKKLTCFDVSKNTALTLLECSFNKLSEAGLNALFGTLHNNEGSKEILVGGNPGYSGCDQSIAEAKGWRISYD